MSQHSKNDMSRSTKPSESEDSLVANSMLNASVTSFTPANQAMYPTYPQSHHVNPSMGSYTPEFIPPGYGMAENFAPRTNTSIPPPTMPYDPSSGVTYGHPMSPYTMQAGVCYYQTMMPAHQVPPQHFMPEGVFVI